MEAVSVGFRHLDNVCMYCMLVNDELAIENWPTPPIGLDGDDEGTMIR